MTSNAHLEFGVVVLPEICEVEGTLNSGSFKLMV